MREFSSRREYCRSCGNQVETACEQRVKGEHWVEVAVKIYKFMRRRAYDARETAKGLEHGRSVIHMRLAHGIPTIDCDSRVWLMLPQIAIGRNNAEVELITQTIYPVFDRA
jgi:hypothetical protein